MQISPREQEKLLIVVAADLAARRRARGLLLNHPEAVAVLTAWVFEAARDGRSVVDLMDAGRRVLTTDDVMEGVADLISDVQVEATFPDGTKLVTLHHPIQPPIGTHGGITSDAGVSVVPGDVAGPDDVIPLNVGAEVIRLAVVNTGDRPIQVGSHYHLAEANPALSFDRVAARGHRLDIPAGTSVRFEPGIEQTVALVPLGGARVVPGLRGETGGALDG